MCKKRYHDTFSNVIHWIFYFFGVQQNQISDLHDYKIKILQVTYSFQATPGIKPNSTK